MIKSKNKINMLLKQSNEKHRKYLHKYNEGKITYDQYSKILSLTLKTQNHLNRLLRLGY